MKYLIPLSFLFVILSGEVREIKFGEDNPLEVHLISLSENSIEMEINLSSILAEEIKIDETRYTRLYIPGGGHTADIGKPELPTVGRYFVVEKGARVKGTIEISDSLVLEDFLLYPAQNPLRDVNHVENPFEIDEKFYRTNELYPSQIFQVSAPIIVRGMDWRCVIFYPVRYRALSKKLIVYTKIRARFDFSFGGPLYEPRKRSPFFEPLLANLLINYEMLGVPPIKQSFEGINTSLNVSGGVNNRQNGADLLIITHDDFYNGILPLAEWRNRAGILTKIVKLAEIGTNPSADDISAYIQDAYDNWAIPPTFVLLVGDVEHLPVHYKFTHPYHNSLIGTDLHYGTVDGNDYFPDIFVGRISVENISELNIVVQKILKYDIDPERSINWFDNVLLAAYNESGRFFVATCESIYVYLNSLGYNSNRQYQAGNPPGSTSGVLSAINGGVIIANHRDHGSSGNDGGSGSTGWVYPNFTTYHISQLTNGDMLPFVLSINCESNWFDGETDPYPGWNYESFGEELLRAEGKGAIGFIGATRVSYSGYNDELDKGFFDAIWPGFDGNYYPDTSSTNPLIGPLYVMGGILNFGKFWMYDKYVLTGGSGYPWSPDPTTTRVEFEMFCLIGEPSLMLRTAYPDSLIVSHPPTIPIGFSQIPFTVSGVTSGPVGGALISLTQEDSVIARGFTDENGELILELLVTSAETINITVTAANHLPYEGIAIPSSQGAFVSIISFSIDDDSIDESYGNGDGVPNPGETIEVPVWVRNWGNESASNVYAILSASDPFIEITDSVEDFGDIPPGDSALTIDDFGLVVSPSCTNNHVLHCNLTVRDTVGNEWVSSFALSINAPEILFYSYIVDDESGGNGNGMIEPGETIKIRLGIENRGNAALDNAFCIIETNDPYITFITDFLGIPNIPAGDTAFTPYFEMAVSSDCPDPYFPLIDITITGWGGITFTDSFTIVVGVTGIDDDFESGGIGWTHLSLTPGYEDEWHLETYRSHSGTQSYKCGGTGYQDYSNFLDAALESPTFTLAPFSILIFWHWMEAETSSAYPGQAYDGGYVEIKIDGEDWIEIYPEGGYPFYQRGGSNSPFPQGKPIFSGSHDWKEERFDLSDYTGVAQLRFRFGSDQAITKEGWYIDDVYVGIQVGVEEASSIEKDQMLYSLFPCSPNPTRNGTEIIFSIPQKTFVTIKLYDVTGRKIKTIEAKEFGPGAHRLKWDGRDALGLKVPSGIYFIKIETEKFTATRKVTVIR